MSLEFLSLETIEAIAQQYGYWAVFLGIMLENAGIPIPGETITLVGGFLAGSGDLTYWWVLTSAIAGAVIGDNVGYWVGVLGGWAILVRIARLFRIKEDRLIAARDQFAENAPKAVFFGRFVALLRIFAGPLAGAVGMAYPKFLLCNLAGAATWASIMVSLSYFTGRLIPLEQLIQWVGQFAVFALLAVIAWIVVPIWLESRSNKAQS